MSLPYIFILLSVTLFPIEVVGQGLVTCSGTECDFCHLADMTNNVIRWLFGFLTLCAVLVFAIAGFKLVTSGGDTSAREWAKERLTYVVIGFLLMFAAWLIVDTILEGLTESGGLEFWGSFDVTKCGEQRQLLENPDAPNIVIAGDDNLTTLVWPGDPQSAFYGSALVSTITCAATPAGNVNCGAIEAACRADGNVPTVDTTNPTNYKVNCFSPANTGAAPQPVAGSGSSGCGGTTCVPITIPCSARGCTIAPDMVSRLERMHTAAAVSGARVTEGMPPSRPHQNPCHTNGSCVDYSKQGGMTADEVTRVINAAAANGLRAVYEVETNAQKNALVRDGVPAGSVAVLGSWITAPHFSIYGR